MGQGVDAFRRALDEAFAAGDVRLILDCAEVPMIDSSGIGLLVKSSTDATKRGGGLRLLNPSKFVTQTLRMIGVLNLFTTLEDEDKAIESFSSNSSK